MQDNDFSTGLQQLFAINLVASTDFRAWFLARTKFGRLWPLARLLHQEQQEWRGQVPWWENWRGNGRHATEMLFIFEVEPTQLRFALHTAIAADVGNLAASKNALRQTAAQSMRDQESLAGYTDFETVLLAPRKLIDQDAHTLSYDRRIPFEDIRGFIPNFGAGRRPAA
ncbi:MAG: hypothetical protein EKK29_17995 [Hyphomicrobiales bacterium]|nr:MAG: hypothetical protein EKK29_17995 [Hyphomicrobiales bacterium]